MQKNKVLFLSAACSIHTVKWVNALSDSFEVHLVFCKNHKPIMNQIKSEVILHELPFRSPIGYYLNALKLKKIFKKINPDIVNVHYASGYGTLARFSKIKPILLSVWGSDVYDFPNESKIKKKILKKNVEYADAIASTSSVMAEELKKQVPNLKKEIFITPFGVNIDQFCNQKKDNIPKTDISIGIVKALEETYGITYAINALEQLIKRLKNNGEDSLANSIKMYIYGDGSAKEKLNNQIIEKKLDNTVFLMGKIPNDEVPKALNDFDIFCATSSRESFGVAVVEAMACELPVVVTDADGFKEVVENNKTGIIVKKENVEEISNALEMLIRDANLRKNMGQNGRRRVEDFFDWTKNVKHMKSIYTELIKEKK